MSEQTAGRRPQAVGVHGRAPAPHGEIRRRISSGSIWEERVGFSRALRVGDWVFVSGTTATDADGNVIGTSDPYAQTIAIIEKIEQALVDAGATLADVVRTRVYVTNADDWEAVGRAHARFFGE